MKPYHGRGALDNPPPRFRDERVEGVDDGWYREEAPDSIATAVRPEPARSIISHNDSPDIPFEQSINPYRGCEHGCPYCLAGDTPILMADGSTRSIAELKIGDAIYGTERDGWYRRYVRTRVLAHWSVIKPAYRVTLEDGTTLVAGGDHRFLTDRGWKFVTGAGYGPDYRPHLTSGNKLMGIGCFATGIPQEESYRRGYVCGLMRSDRLARCDAEALQRAQHYLQADSVVARRCAGIYAAAPPRVQRVREFTAWPLSADQGWCAGFLAAAFDAEGSYSGGGLRISTTEGSTIAAIAECLRRFGFRFRIEQQVRGLRRPIQVVHLLGGLVEHLRLFHTVDPATLHKRDIAGQAVESEGRLRVNSIEPLGGAMRLFDITTGTGDFLANGVVSHNCYARPSHAYLDLSPGLDFETRIFYKANAADRLQQELSRPSYAVRPITLGANTDPYQPLERKLRVTRSLLEVLESTRHPVSIVTKGALILRDLDLLRSLAQDELVHVFVSVTSLDAELKRTLEPRAASPQARLRVIRELSAAGVPTGVLFAPVIPAVNDSELERIIDAAAEAGALRAGYVLLRLPHEVKQLFRQWLEEHLPQRADHVMSLIREARGGRDNDPRFGIRMTGMGAWARLLADRFALACKRHGLSASRWRELSCRHFRAPQRDGGQICLPL